MFTGTWTKSSVNKERANCADVVAKSYFHNYSLVGDAKAFRLSRTAKNQKDFKVKSMADWKGQHNFAIIVCPFFQYPRTKSQIFGQALDDNVLLFSWEHLAFLIKEKLKETQKLNLSPLWNLSHEIGSNTSVSAKNISFFDKQISLICKYTNNDISSITKAFNQFKTQITIRSSDEINFWTIQIETIKKYSKEEAIEELIKALKINEKIISIKKFINYLSEI